MPTPDYSSLLSCTVGTAAFEVITYEAEVTPVVRPGIGHVADQVRATITGQIQGTNPADLTAKITAFGLAVGDGQNVSINGLAGSPEFVIQAARSFDGGPFFGVKIADGPTAMVKSITLTVTNGQLPSGSSQGLNKYAVQTAMRADGLRTVTWDGEAISPLGGAYFLENVLAKFQAAYPLPDWSVRVEYKTAQEGVIPRLSYQLVATEMFGQLPANEGGTSVDGSISTRIERDEQMRKTTVMDFDLLLDQKSDPHGVLTAIRADLAAGGTGTSGAGAVIGQTNTRLILRESATIETLRENRLRASFTILESGWHDNLMNWSRTIRVTHDDQPVEEHRYIGADPILVVTPKRLGRITDTGSAVGAGQFVKPPDELFGSLPHEQPPHETYLDRNEAEKETTWERAYFVPAAAAGGQSVIDTLDPNQLARPDANKFYPAAANVDEPPDPGA